VLEVLWDEICRPASLLHPSCKGHIGKSSFSGVLLLQQATMGTCGFHKPLIVGS